MTKLDEAVFALIQRNPDWVSGLAADEQALLNRRRAGATFRELARELRLTPAGVRFRLYGGGAGCARRGGILGKLRGLALRERMKAHR